MNFSLLRQRSPRIILGLIMLLALIAVTSDIAFSQKVRPAIPILSLTGNGNSYDKLWYPDGVLRVSPSDNVEGTVKEFGQEILVPVFIDNKWTKYPGDGETDEDVNGTIFGDKFVPKEVYSFEFKIHYDSTAFRCVGIQKFHPYEIRDDRRFQVNCGNNVGQYYEPLAKDFHIEWHDFKDPSYRAYFATEEQPDVEKNKGRTIKIIGSSSKPLPRCCLANDDYRVLLYIKFRIVNNGNLGSYKTPIYIGNDTIIYNDMNVCMDRPFGNLYNKPGYTPAEWPDDYPDPNPTNDPKLLTNTAGLGGFHNYNVLDPTNENTSSEYMRNNGIRYREGVIWAWFFTQSPNLGFDVPDALVTDPIVEEDPELQKPEFLMLKEPITVDWNNIGEIPARRNIQLLNLLDDSRLTDLEIISDQKWLVFNTIDGPGLQNPIRNETDNGLIPWIDRGILGPFEETDPNDDDTEDDGDVILQVKCDPNKLTDIPNDIDKPGIYTGYITFKSRFMKESPIRLKVTFIYFKTPDEWNIDYRSPGIELIVRNSRGLDPNNPNLPPGPDSVKLIFGTGERATNTVDALYGEKVQLSEMLDPFDARWFPTADWVPEVDLGEAVKNNLKLYGYGDWAPNIYNPRSNSRDIRNIKKIDESLIYYAKINSGHANTFPVTIEWNALDFPEGSILYLRDAINGSFFNVDMRNSTPLPGDQRFSYVINDPKYTEFIIEYTPARVIQYLDNDGNPIIKKGWNLLSLPVRPVNARYNAVYPHAMNKPYKFSLSQYQDQENLVPGTGYFIKYSDVIDTRFAGSYIGEISKSKGYNNVLYPGWNTVGALSIPTGINEISFDAYENTQMPDKAFTKRYGVWGYKTNRGYEEVATLEPGLGYWIKVGIENDPIGSEQAHGYYHLVPPTRIINTTDFYSEKFDTYNNSSKLVVKDNAQSEGKVYITLNKNVDVNSFELPPVPPAGYFDIRFNGNKNLSNETVSIVKLQGVEYPVSINIENAGSQFELRDAVSNEYLGTINSGSSNSVMINSLKGNSIKVIRTEEAPVAGFTFSAYPNPAEVETGLNFTMPEAGNVTIKLYDIVGNEVATVVNGLFYNAGEFTVPFNVTNLAGGKYIAKITAGSYSSVSSISVVR